MVAEDGTDEVKIAICSVAEVDHVWPIVSESLRKASVRCGGEVDPIDHWRMCRSGSAFLVVAIQRSTILAAGVWRFEEWLTGKKLRCLAIAGGSMSVWYPSYREFIVKMAKIGHATSLVTDGRTGWQRIEPEAKVLRQLYEVKI